MGVIVSQIQSIINDPFYAKASRDFHRMLAKDFFISYFLSFIYNHKNYRRLIFYGGTCSRVVYGLERISEDIDLDNSDGVDLTNLADELVEYIKHNLQINGADVYCQKGEWGIQRWTVRMPIMKELGLSPNPTEKLHLKIEISRHQQIRDVEVTPVLRHGQTMAIRHFDEASLFSGKIIACLEREWKKNGKDGIKIKGRDYFDLIWFMSRRVKPNEKKLARDAKKTYTMQSAMQALGKKIKLISKEDLLKDLQPFFPQPVFVEEWVKNFKEFFERYAAFYKTAA